MSPETEVIDLGYRARSQFIDYHRRKERWACIVAHRRAGKTVACVMDLVDDALRCDKPEGRFAYISPTYTQSKDVAWSYLKSFTAKIPGVEQRESDLSVIFPNGSRVRLYGADNYDRMRGLYFDGAVLDEFADMDPRAWPEVIRPALADRKGRATFIGTPKGRNAFHELWKAAQEDPEWFTALLRADRTGLLPEDELQSLKKLLTPEQYAQEMLCSFDAAIVGAYYGREMEAAEADGRIAKVALDRSADVFASWDLGIADSTAIWVGQLVGREWHWLDYYEASGQALDHFVDWVKARGYTIHEHLLPHDAEARELQTGKSRRQFLEERGLNVRIVPRHEVMDGIDAARVRFNRMWFDADRCARGLDCLRMYRADYDDKNQVLRPRPLHDWASHGADAFRYGVMGADDRPQQKDLPQVSSDWVV